MIFRTLANGEVYYFNASILLKDNSSYEDTLSDAQIAFNEQLLIANAFPPIFTIDGRVGGKFLTEVNERYWLAIGSRVYHSLISNPHAWVPEHSFNFDSDVTALARSGESIVIFIGQGTPWIISGNAEDGTAVKKQIPSTQGCPNFRTIAYLGNSLMFQSQDGECILQERPLGQLPSIQVITKNKYNFPSIGNFALANKDTYFLFFDTEVVVFDISRDQITTRSLTADYGFVDELTGIMYLVEQTVIYDANGGTSIEQQMRTGKLYDGRAATLKSFKIIEFETSHRLIAGIPLSFHRYRR